jgi:hypothetical protein
MSSLPKYPPDGLNVIELQEWAAKWSADTRRQTTEYAKAAPFMPLEDWLAMMRHLHWKQGRSAEAYTRARSAAEKP